MAQVTDAAADRHVVDDGEAFAWSLEFAADDASFAGATGVTWDPVAGVRRYHLHLFLPDGVVVVRDDDVARPVRGRACDGRADALWFSYTCGTPLAHWSCAVEAFGLFATDGDDLVPAGGGPAVSSATFAEIGERIPVGIDIDFEAGTPGRAEGRADDFVQAGRVHGDLLVGAAVHPVDVPALRRVVRGAVRDRLFPTSHTSTVAGTAPPGAAWTRVRAVPVPVVTVDGSRELWRRVLLRLDPDVDGAAAGFRFGPADTTD